MKTKMNRDILVTILAVRSHYSAFYYDMEQRKRKQDWRAKDYGAALEDTAKYFKSLSLPDGMDHSEACFNAILAYPVYGEIYHAEEEDYDKFEFGF